MFLFVSSKTARPLLLFPTSFLLVKGDGLVLFLAQGLPFFGLRVPVARRGGGESTSLRARLPGESWRTAINFQLGSGGGRERLGQGRLLVKVSEEKK